MGLGAIITSGPENRPLGADLMRWVAEVRVEQDLSRPASYAVRFEEDLCEGQPASLNAKELKPGVTMAIVVEVEDKRYCLVQGPIDKVKSSAVVGGPGSWYEVHGVDRRVEMDRVGVQAAYGGRASEVAAAILSSHGFEAEVTQTTRVYDKRKRSLNQSATDLKFIEQIARENNLEFWITYEIGSGPPGLSLPTPGGGAAPIDIKATAHLAPSPPRPAGGIGLPALPGPIPLVPTGTKTLNVHTQGEECANVNSFDLEIDVERATAALVAAVNERDGSVQKSQATDPQPATGPGGRLPDIAGAERRIIVPAAGDPEDGVERGKAAVTRAGWFVKATASTTTST